MQEHEPRYEGSGEGGSGTLPGQEEHEGAGGGPSAGHDDPGAISNSIDLDELPEPQGDPIDLDELHEEQEQADAVKLAEIRAELADLSPPEGDAYSDTGESEGDNYEDETEIDAEDYEELDDYEEADDYEDEPVTEAETGEGL